MRLRSLAFALPFCAALAAMQPPTRSQGPGGPPPRKPGGDVLRFSARLELSQAQIDQIRAILDAHKASSQPKHEALHAARKAFGEAMEAPSTPESRITELKAVLDAAELAVLKEDRAIGAEVRAILTEAQATKLDQIRAEAREHQDRPGKGRGHHEAPPAGSGANAEARP